MVEGVHHVALEVDDLAAAVGFYGVLGFRVLPRPESLGSNGVWLGAGGLELHLIEVDAVGPIASNHVALRVADNAAVVAALREAGIEVSDPFDIGAGIQSFLHDPAGNLIELNQPTT